MKSFPHGPAHSTPLDKVRGGGRWVLGMSVAGKGWDTEVTPIRKVGVESPDLKERGGNDQNSPWGSWWRAGLSWGREELCFLSLPADGVVRTTMPLDLARAQGAGVMKLQVRAFEKLRPWASAEFDLTVNVRAVNQWPPRCHPALLV